MPEKKKKIQSNPLAAAQGLPLRVPETQRCPEPFIVLKYGLSEVCAMRSNGATRFRDMGKLYIIYLIYHMGYVMFPLLMKYFLYEVKGLKWQLLFH